MKKAAILTIALALSLVSCDRLVVEVEPTPESSSTDQQPVEEPEPAQSKP